MSKYIDAFDNSWQLLTEWVESGRFRPRNEEDIQCFLFYGLVTELGTAIGVRTKAGRGNLWFGTKHYPDFVLGVDFDNPELIVEIKFQTTIGSGIYNGCKKDIEKLKKYYDSQPHRFVLFDESRYKIFLSQGQYNELAAMASDNCRIFHYPTDFDSNV